MQRRLSLLKQWSKERFRTKEKTETSEDFKALEAEIELRHVGFRRLYACTKTYSRWLGKRYTGVEKTKDFPVSHLGVAMVDHGFDFDDDVEFGQCLSALGEVEERLGHIQEAYLANVTSCWQESLEASLAQIKEYQESRKLLESKRLAYDAARSQLAKSKKDDPRLEDAVVQTRKQYADIYKENVRMMREISDAENDTIVDLTSFVGAQISYHERCLATLVELKEKWPASVDLVEQSASQIQADHVYRSARSLASTGNLLHQHDDDEESEEDASSSEATESTQE